METSDSVVAKGWVDPYFFSPSTGERRPFGKRRNSVSYTGASAMAIAWSGDSSFIPSEVGIIYVSPSSAAYLDFGSDSSGSGGSVNQLSVSRIQSWSSLTAELDSAGASILERPFSYAPSVILSASGDSAGYYKEIVPSGANAAVFHAHSDSGMPDGSRICQAVLMSKKASGNRTDRYILARVDLGDGGVYQSKPSGFEIAIDWTIKFF